VIIRLHCHATWVLPDGATAMVAAFTRAARGDRRQPRVDAAIGQAARYAVGRLR